MCVPGLSIRCKLFHHLLHLFHHCVSYIAIPEVLSRHVRRMLTQPHCHEVRGLAPAMPSAVNRHGNSYADCAAATSKQHSLLS